MMVSILIITGLVAITVVIHCEVLRKLWITIPKLRMKHRVRVITGILGTICAHIIGV